MEITIYEIRRSTIYRISSCYREGIMNFLDLFSKEKSKEVSIAAAKGSIPAAGATGIITGVSAYLGVDLPVESIVALFFGGQLSNIIGQFQKSPVDALRSLKLLFNKKG